MTVTTPHQVAFVDSMPQLADPVALRESLADNGYLFFRGLIPRADVLGVRLKILELLRDRGWVAEGTELIEGVADVDAFARVPKEELAFCGGGLSRDAYLDIYKLEQFHQLSHHASLLSVYESIFGGPVLPHPRNIARVMIKNETSAPTPPHQDFIHIQGSKETMTAWIPLGDCPQAHGGLSVLSGSHKEGVLSYHEAKGAGAMEAYLCDLDYPWAVTNYSAGDVLTFTSTTVHRALPHQATDRIRLSADFRYQPRDHIIDPSSLEPHCRVATWQEIYVDWTDKELQYFWLENDLSLSEWDEGVRWQKDRIC